MNYSSKTEKNTTPSLTVSWVSHWIRLGVIVHTVYQLWTNRRTIIFHCFDLRWSRRGVCSKNGLTELSAVGVMPRVTAAHRAHCGERDDTEMQRLFVNVSQRSPAQPWIWEVKHAWRIIITWLSRTTDSHGPSNAHWHTTATPIDLTL